MIKLAIKLGFVCLTSKINPSLTAQIGLRFLTLLFNEGTFDPLDDGGGTGEARSLAAL
jgi:hypothetical protein